MEGIRTSFCFAPLFVLASAALFYRFFFEFPAIFFFISSFASTPSRVPCISAVFFLRFHPDPTPFFPPLFVALPYVPLVPPSLPAFRAPFFSIPAPSIVAHLKFRYSFLPCFLSIPLSSFACFPSSFAPFYFHPSPHPLLSLSPPLGISRPHTHTQI